MFVLTVDQQNSRRGTDLVEPLLCQLADRGEGFVRTFERTAGDELQGVLDDPAQVVSLVLALLRDDAWSIGLGVGAVHEPLPASTRAGSGPAFALAREAVTRAKVRPSGLAVRAEHAPDGRRAETALDLLAAVVARRSPQGWEAVDLATAGLSQTEIASRLGVSKQAVSQRLRAAEWHLDAAAHDLAAHLLSVADARVEAP